MRLVVEGLACERGGRTLFRDLSFTVERGSGLVLTGPNGVGKTSLLRVLGGLLRPSAGRLFLEGGDPEAGLAEQSHLIGMREALKPSLTVVEHVRFWRELLGGKVWPPSHKDDRFEPGVGAWEGGQLSGAFLLREAHLPAAYLSSGQRRRLALVRLSCVKRSIWLLDEPFNALDSGSREAFRSKFIGHMASGGILVAATHDPLSLPYTRVLSLKRDMEGAGPERAA